VTALQSPDTRVKLMSIEALRKIGPAADPAVPAIVSWIESDTRWMKVQGMACIDEILTQPQVTVPSIIKCLGDANRNVAQNARRLLLKYGQAALPMLEEALEEPGAVSKNDIQEIITTIKGSY